MQHRFYLFILSIAACTAFAEIEIPLGEATLHIDEKGYVNFTLPGGPEPWPMSHAPIIRLSAPTRVLEPDAVYQQGNVISVHFPDGSHCDINAVPGDGFAVLEVANLAAPPDVNAISLCSIAVPPNAEILDTLNAARTGAYTVALSAAELNVHAFAETAGRVDSDRAGCSHEFVPAPKAKSGSGAARFNAACNEQNQGWSFCGRSLTRPLDLTGLKSIRAWVRGDAKGELLNIQLYDGMGGYRDTYIPIGFEGWQQIDTNDAELNTLRADHVSSLNLYYNGIPASQTVSCDIDRIEAVLVRGGKEEVVLLEEFESDSPYWTKPTHALNLETIARHGLTPARFGVLATRTESFFDAMERFERAANIPSPHPGGIWNKRSPLTKRSYLFITNFSEPETEDVIAMAKRGGFDTIIILQDSWTHSTGHFEVNDKAFPGGLDTLKRTVQRMKDAGFHVGFHFLGPSIYPNDPYVTPVPDPRLAKWASADLADAIDPAAATLPLSSSPESFPAEDGGYMGNGTIVQIGNELIAYGDRTLSAPFALTNCQRGALGTVAAPHGKGDRVQHVKRSYGYFLYDMDTSLIDEVTSNFARIANACDIDMIYFDGSENLQGEHWYYNPRMHKAFYDKLDRKDILLQASSFSHYSWHMLARSASADGHDDLKLYLDERSGAFDLFRSEGMNLDIGWYYGYDPRSTPDMFEYVLGATIGYDSSMSFQVSLDAARKHPFIGEILDLIARYEALRLSGRVPREMRDRMRIDADLAGVKPEAERAVLTEKRREYRLLRDNGQDFFQRVVYTPWHDVKPGDASSTEWKINATDGPSAVGVQFNLVAGPWMAPGPSYDAPDALTLESFDELTPYSGGSTLQGVSQRFNVTDDARAGAHAAEYAAESTLGTANGWSYVGKTFNPPLDLSWHKAIGFWLRGDAKGGAFKLQLTDGAHATDYYIANDYSGWRYQQLTRPAPDPMDYAHVQTLGFYYNGLPGKTAVSCAIDDVRALRSADSPALIDPYIQVDGTKLSWSGALAEGEYVFLMPNEPARRYGPELASPQTGSAPPNAIQVSKGEHIVHFGSANAQSVVRARVVLQPVERYQVP